MTEKKQIVRIAALGDLHVRETSQGSFTDLFADISEKADILVLCGDLTDHGLPGEAEVLAKEFLACRIPIVGVLGNHDLEGDVPETIKQILHDAKMIFLDEENYELYDVGFTGTKGFMGGFDKYALGALHWEKSTRLFVEEAVNEALKLENGLARLQTKYKIAALHYAPIRETIEGEPLELYPYLGSSRLAEPLDSFEASVVFHGHADYGKPEGKTLKGIPVYNVAYPLLQRVNPKQPYRLVEL